MSEHSDKVILDVRNLRKFFPIRRGLLRRVVGAVRAVDDVSFSIRRGEIVSLVGESGCGKTTTARCIMRAYRPTSGQILFANRQGETVDLAQLPFKALRGVRSEIQMVFQDPVSSLNPRMNVLDIIAESLLVHGMKSREQRVERVAELMRLVGLRPEYMKRFPHAFSGGERQRIGIARALALSPSLVIADEPVSALDVSVQAQILNLLLELQGRLSLAVLFVAHDLSVVRHVSHRVAVMYVGRIVETASSEDLFARPQHPYTEALLSAVPRSHPLEKSERIVLEGEVADPANPPPGCHFAPRCKYAVAECTSVYRHGLSEVSPGRAVACLRASELRLAGVRAAARN